MSDRVDPVHGERCTDCSRTNHPGLACNEHDPQHEFDCTRCKFSWNCGTPCACALRNVDKAPTWLVARIEYTREERRAE